jgi:hypothetical protein
MLNPNTVYFKTEAGMGEVKARAMGLRAELRRLLILIDGNATVGRLAAFVRGSEVDFLIAELESLGLVTSGASSGNVATVTGVATPAPVAAPTDPSLEPTAAQMQAVRRAAIRSLHDTLGPDADTLAVKVERCKDAQELRVAITEIRLTLDRQVGIAAGQRFLDAVRSAAEGTR